MPRVERLVGARVGSYRRVEGGYTPALRLLCETAADSFFAKIGRTPSTAKSLSREIHVYNSLSGDFMPRLLASEDHESEPILIIEDLTSHQKERFKVRGRGLFAARALPASTCQSYSKGRRGAHLFCRRSKA